MIDPYPISALADRYKLNSKQAIYDRIKALNIVPVSRGKLRAEQVLELDELDKHLINGGSFANFLATPVINSGITNIKVDLRTSYPEEKQWNTPISQLSLHGLYLALNHAANQFKSDPLAHYELLERARLRGWLLTTAECTEILGVKPRGKVFTRGSFVLSNVGKIGNQKAWKITEQEL